MIVITFPNVHGKPWCVSTSEKALRRNWLMDTLLEGVVEVVEALPEGAWREGDNRFPESLVELEAILAEEKSS